MVIRERESNRFPVTSDKGIWFFIVSFQEGNLNHEDFKSSQEGLRGLTNQIQDYSKKIVPFSLYGVWQGQHRTDIFVLNPQLMAGRFSEYLKKKEEWRADRRAIRKQKKGEQDE